MCFYTNTHNTNSNQRWQVLRVCGVKPNGLDSFDLEAKWHFTIALSPRPNCGTSHLMKFKPNMWKNNYWTWVYVLEISKLNVFEKLASHLNFVSKWPILISCKTPHLYNFQHLGMCSLHGIILGFQIELVGFQILKKL
jgi:hypothetical protein